MYKAARVRSSPLSPGRPQTMSNPPKKIIGHCFIGAAYAPSRGNIDGRSARSLVTQNSDNLIPQTYFYQADKSVSDRLTACAQGAGGIMPEANGQIGAPLSTFVYGGITPDAVHPQLTLIKGPPVGPTYNPTFSSTAALGGTVGGGTLAPSSQEPSVSDRPVHPPQYPTVPAVQAASGAPFDSATTPIATYNIWQITNLDAATAAAITYKQNFGPLYPNSYDSARIRQNTGVDGSMYVEVTAQNVTAHVRRVFPIASDLLYDPNTSLYYPHPTLANLNRAVQARGGENCGFQLHFIHSEVTQMSNPNSKQVTGGISIFWGAADTPKGGSLIQNFNLILYPDKTPELYFFHPRKQVWENFPLQGPAFGSGEFEIYVHYAGPHMLIGFEADPSGWNCFTPHDDDRDWSKAYYPSIPADAGIGMIFDNITAAFQYGPIAFNSYHPEKVATQADFNNGLDQGTIQVPMSVPSSQQALIDPAFVNGQFQGLRFDRDSSAGLESRPTIYGDYRSQSAELQFGNAAAGTTSGQDYSVMGTVTYVTTVEGPQFIHVRNFVPTTYTPTPGALVQPLQWGDLSEYMSDFAVSYTTEGKNKSILMASAEVTLNNLALSVKGRQILQALEENILTVTLLAGAGQASTFFQGTTQTVDTQYSQDGSVTTLTCLDMANSILGEVPFPTVLYFSMERYGKIIEECVDASGLGSWYSQQQTGAGSAFQNALDVRLGTHPFESDLAHDIMSATPRKYVMDTITDALELVITPNALPVFFWDGGANRLRLNWRNDPSQCDLLYFLGSPDTSGQETLPNSNPQGQHGVIEKEYSTRTEVKQLHAGVLLAGINWYHRSMQYKSLADDAFSPTGIAKLNALVGGDASEEVGYVGFRKILVDETQVNNLPDQNSLNAYGGLLMNNYLRHAYSNLKFSCWVTRPLQHQATFRVQTFLGEQDPGGSATTDLYLYSSVRYVFNKGQGTLKADVEGEMFPKIIVR
jgi:hypothetical protein